MLDSVCPVLDGCNLEAATGMYNPLIVQEQFHYQGRFRLIFVNYQCVGILGNSSGGGQLGSDAFYQIVSCLVELLKSVQIDDIAAEIGITRQGWHLIELVRPPRSWPGPEGAVDRFNLISGMIECDEL
jgi:hypothetical protein